MKKIAVMLAFLNWACIKDVAIKPLEDYYGFQDISQTKTKTKRPKEIILGFDSPNLNLASLIDVAFLEKNSQYLNVPGALINYYIDGVMVKDGIYKFEKPGTFTLLAKLGEISSDPVTITAYDADRLRVKFVVSEEQKQTFEADGLKNLDLNYTATYDGKTIPLPEGFTLFINDVNTFKIDPRSFNTISPKQYVFSLRRGTYIGTDLVVVAPSPVKKIELKTTYINATEDLFYNDGISKCDIQIIGFNKEGKQIPLSEDIKYFKNGQNLGTAPASIAFTTKEEGETTFQFKGFGIESEVLKIVAVSPPNSQTKKMPVVFHMINARNLVLTETRLQAVLSQVNSLFRNTSATINRQPTSLAAADTFIEFYLASKDPEGKELSTKGLNIVKNAPVSFAKVKDIYTDDFIFNTQWNVTQYINVFLCNFTNEDFAAFAYLPGSKVLNNKIVYDRTDRSFLEEHYGAYMNNTLDPPVLAHELGHMLGLLHAFGSAKNCETRTPDDYCTDTPDYNYQQYLLDYVQQRYNRVSCTSQPFVSTNIMDYGITYTNNFTKDQAEIMRNITLLSDALPNGNVVPVRSKYRKPAFNPAIHKPIVCNH